MKRSLGYLLAVGAVVAVWVEAGDQRRRPETDAFRATSQAVDRYRVRLGSVDLIPEGGLHAVEVDSVGPFLIQFHQVPDAAARTRIAEKGITLVRYVGGASYLARCMASCSDALSSLPIRSTFDLTPAMKLAPVFQTDGRLRARLNSGSPLDVVVRFHPWVPWDQARFVLEQCGAALNADRLGYGGRVAASVDSDSLRALLHRIEAAWVDPALPAPGPSLVHAARRSRVDQVRGMAEFLGVDGSGSRVGILDWFPAEIHADLAGRVTPVDVRWGEDEHGVTISGCVAGAGTLEPRATGAAPGASLFWTSWVPDPWTAMQRLYLEHGVTIVNNSWNTKPGWWLTTGSWHGDLWAFGYYHERAEAADALVRDTDLLVVFSVGNKRLVSFLGPHTHGDQYGVEDNVSHEDMHPPNPDVPSVAGAAVAKNVLSVGGTTKDDEMDPFSSIGPIDDGRVKPDLVAVGVDVLTTADDDGYVAASGTSISAPVVSGVAALLADYSRRRHGREPSSLVLKNLLIHSARDLGEPGPDYRSGFGMADAEFAARILDAAVYDDSSFRLRRGPARRVLPAGSSTRPKGRAAKVSSSPAAAIRSLVIEDVLDHGERVTYVLPVARDCDEVRATLVWHDPPGPELINDLDLVLVAPGGQEFRPFVLDPDRPSAAASRGVNHRDNVEQVRVLSPKAGMWRILLDGTVVADGPQELALIASAGDGNRAPEKFVEGDLVIDEFFATGDDSSAQSVGPWTVFRDGDPLNFYIEGSILANADYGDLFGSIALTTSITDNHGDTVVRFNTSGNGSGPGPLQFLLDVGFEIPAEMPAGTYTAHAELAMHNGVRRTANHAFTVE